tara:strand:- start:357 stop:1604 length:1248 start_codon:yes stop_codon:yes gene_type:complete
LSREEDPELIRVQRTFFAESARAVCAGVIETALATFGVLIAVKVFHSGPGVKAMLLAAPAIGLIASLGAVSWVSKSRLKASHAAGVISLLSMLGFGVAAIGARHELCFLVGITVGIGVISMALPLQTHYLRVNYPARRRGRLFSVSIVIRAATAMIVSWTFGEYLNEDFNRYPILLWCFGGAAAVSAVCHFAVPSEPLRPAEQKLHGFMESVQLSLGDRVFTRLLVAAMVMGVGVLSANALRVDYLVNPEHGLNFDVKTVSLITGVVPSAMRLISTFFWGWLFDRVNFFRLRIAINVIFLVGIVLYFAWPDTRLIVIGSALFGLARGGGEILFNLFVTKFAKPEYVADYMSVHTFLAGIRLLLAPFLGFFLVKWANIPVMVAFSISLVVASVFIVGSVAGHRRDEMGEGGSASKV